MISEKEIRDFENRIESMIEASTENMIKNVISSNDALNPESLECLKNIRIGNEMLQAAQKLKKI
ncbi:hypothetical protein [Methanosarcina siciliae]|uniref:hypothetical protein n=1 Tax=Methanosarcina siciliae TaxID=38027 RepID=UPI00064EB77F|nr:hypothetical protein [Methanosarcina siciliae]